MFAAVAAAIAAPGSVGGPAGPHCETLLPETEPRSLPGRPQRRVGADDLIRLRDFGQTGTGYGDEALFTVSPDQKSAALLLRQAHPETNGFCQGLVIVDLATGRTRLVDIGGELVRPTYAHSRVLAGFPMGVPMVITPSWSPDGQWLLFLKRDRDLTEAWRVRVDGGAIEQVTHEPQDLTSVAWSRDGRRILYRTDRALAEAQKAIDVEGLSGWHYDARFSPVSTARPYPRPTDPSKQVYSLDPFSGALALASADERQELDELAASSLARSGGPGANAAMVDVSTEDPAIWRSPRILRARFAGGERVCREEACRKVQGYWIAPDGRSVTLLSRSGWGDGDLTFFRWTLDSGRLTRLSTTSDMLIGCRPVGGEMLCARETSTLPRRLEMVDPDSGRSRTIFNPNPDYDRLTSGRVERLELTSAHGEKTFADLMVPAGSVAGRPVPLVVVQYESRGFLRGGTGEEFPIPAFASAGIAVLSFQRPPEIALSNDPPPANSDEFLRIDNQGWADRRNVHSALMDGIEQVVRRGIADPHRLGITGLSDGLATTAFALVNSDRFAVAAVNGCCEEPINNMALQGPEFARMMAASGLPRFSQPEPERWADYSVVQNAGRVRAPLLIQAPDREFILSVPAYQALRETKLPVELYVYPGEYHVKWQPAHKLAVYERDLRWFEFWFDLAAPIGQSSAPAGERERWEQMRHVAQGAGRIGEAVMPSP